LPYGISYARSLELDAGSSTDLVERRSPSNYRQESVESFATDAAGAGKPTYSAAVTVTPGCMTS